MAGKSNGLESTDWARAPSKTGPFWQRALKAIYDPDEKTFLGRTAKRWGIVLVFYLVFYAVLALLFAICMAGLFSVLDDKKPTFILDSSLIGSNPGVASRPRPIDGVTLHITNSSNIEYYVNELQEFMEPYANDFSLKRRCTKEDNYGFPQSPCIFIKLNRIFGWKPDVFKFEELPDEMPEDLIQHIEELPENQRKQVWLSCWDEHSNETQIQYPWERGMPGRYYPYQNEIGYRSPLIPVKLTPPANKLVTIRCRAWAKNIIYNKSLKEPSGYVRILLQVDEDAIPPVTEATTIFPE